MKPLLQGLGGALVGGGLTLVLLRTIQLPKFELDRIEGLALLLLLAPAFLFVVAVHEAGHLLAGATQRFRPHLFIVGPLKLERRGSRWTVGRNRSMSMFGGMAAGFPEGTDRLRQRLFVLVAGGPAASLITAVLGIALLAAVSPAQPPRATLAGGDAVVHALLLMVTLLSLMIGVVALFPSQTGGYASDGAQLLRFRRSSPEVEAEVALIALSITSVGGGRPRDWDRRLLDRALTLAPDSSRGVTARLLAHVHALDTSDVERADLHLRSALDASAHASRLVLPSLLLHAAEFAALHQHDAAAARRHFDAVHDGTLVGTSERAFAEAAVLHAEGKDGVEALLTHAESELSEALDRGGAIALADRIKGLRRARAFSVRSEPPTSSGQPT